LLKLGKQTKARLADAGIDVASLKAEIVALGDKNPRALIDAAYDSDNLAHGLRILADHDARVVVGYTGSDVQAQHRVLGYRFSKSRGSEGCVLFEENGVIQTRLYDPLDLDNQERFAGAVLARMEGRTLAIPQSSTDFMQTCRTTDLWTLPQGTLENPSSIFVSTANLPSASPYGDFIDELPCAREPLSKWLKDGRVMWVKGAGYDKRLEVPRATEIRILTASNIDLATHKLTLNQFRFLATADKVTEEMKPRRDDIMICIASGSLSHLGKIAIVDDDVDGYIGGFLAILRCADPVNRKILEYNLLSARFRNMVGRSKEQNISNLGKAKLGAFELLVPTNRQAFTAQVKKREGRSPSPSTQIS
jgi:hypothetical protein